MNESADNLNNMNATPTDPIEPVAEKSLPESESVIPMTETLDQDAEPIVVPTDSCTSDKEDGSVVQADCMNESIEPSPQAKVVESAPSDITTDAVDARSDGANVNSTQQSDWIYAQAPHIDSSKKKKKKSTGKALFVALTGIVLVCVVAFAAVLFSGDGQYDEGNSLSDVPEISAVSSADHDEEGLSAAEIYQKTFKSCVSVLAYEQNSGELSILGSGVICQEDTQGKYTYIVTCAHVINESDYNIKIETWDGKVYTAEVVNYDDTNDIGVVRIAASGLQIAEFGDSTELQPGASVYALGTPYSSKFAGTFTRGMVSAVNRLVTTKTSYQLSCIQHDAPINNGNSGGALFNAYGQVVGINALKISASGYEGLGFAVPSETVLKVVNSIIETGIAPKTPKLGISYIQAIYYSQFLAEFIEENNYPGGAIVVAEITKDSGLYNTELQVNDIIIGVNGLELTTPDVLVQIIQNAHVGDTLTLSVIRIIMNEDNTDYVDVEEFEVTAALTEKKNDESSTDSQYEGYEDFYEYFGDDSGDYEDFYDYFYDYFYGGGNSYGNNDTPEGDNRFSIPND